MSFKRSETNETQEQSPQKLLEDITIAERGLPIGEETLKRGLLEMIRMILNHKGQIHYAPGVCRNRAQHFHTDKPTYFKGQ